MVSSVMDSRVRAHKTRFELLASPGFTTWLDEQQVSLGFTTYQTGKLFLVGHKSNGQLSAFERNFMRCLGLWADDHSLWMSSQFQLWRFQNVLPSGDVVDGYDRLYVPRVSHTTGDLDIHDVAVDANGRPVFVNTLFGCLATVSERFNFEPLWRPPFLSWLAAEDRCHLNGLAMEHGQPRYVTACAQTDVAQGWREHRRDSGCVIDVASNELIATGLSMPHSPRLYRDRLWLLNSGTGHLGFVDRTSGRFEPVTFYPGYARGLALVGDYAVVGLSRPREQTFQGLPLDDHLAQRNTAAKCGLQVVDLASGQVVHWLKIDGDIEELYDVIVLPGAKRPKVFGFKTDEIRRNVWFEEENHVQCWSGRSHK